MGALWPSQLAMAAALAGAERLLISSCQLACLSQGIRHGMQAATKGHRCTESRIHVCKRVPPAFESPDRVRTRKTERHLCGSAMVLLCCMLRTPCT